MEPQRSATNFTGASDLNLPVPDVQPPALPDYDPERVYALNEEYVLKVKSDPKLREWNFLGKSREPFVL